jgi:hypothetical protein
MGGKHHEDVQFVVLYRDGRTVTMYVDPFTLRGGDHIALEIARESQRRGQMPEGEIASVERVQ